ncbi:MAG: GatB/YqeY domain-containing protein, partial [Candidatus Neomarinimicrobiota bacterium]|nr:GatB/YqeY domain-containing protein [Candidatus Neomarinimicrobiota bacterium]
IEKIKTEMYDAMKSGKKDKAGTLRTLLAKLKDKEINKRKELSEKDGLAVIKTLVKQRKESVAMYEKANRTELADKEKNELSILESYLPKMMLEDDIRGIVAAIIEETGATGMGDIGKVMPVVMQRGAGSIDGKTANVILRELLG